MRDVCHFLEVFDAGMPKLELKVDALVNRFECLRQFRFLRLFVFESGSTSGVRDSHTDRPTDGQDS